MSPQTISTVYLATGIVLSAKYTMVLYYTTVEPSGICITRIATSNLRKPPTLDHYNYITDVPTDGLVSQNSKTCESSSYSLIFNI